MVGCFPHHIQLTAVMRQDSKADDKLIKAIDECSRGCVSNETEAFLKSLDKPSHNDAIHLYPTNTDVDIHNHAVLMNLPGMPKVYEAKKEFGPKKLLKKFPAPSVLYLKVNC